MSIRTARSRTHARVFGAGLTSALVTVVSLAGLAAPGNALPPGGASADTPGTSGTASPRQLPPGGTISFSIRGFPAGEVVSVKIDDGDFCSAQGVHGACVVHQQKSGKDGSVRGSFELPSDLSAGQHWLRFLASSEMKDENGEHLGVKPYSLRGDTTFTVVTTGGSASSGSGAGSSQGSAATGQGAAGTSGTAGSRSGSGSSGGSTGSTGSGSSAGTTGSPGSDATGSTGGAGTAATPGAVATDPATGEVEETVPGALRVPAPSGSPRAEGLQVAGDEVTPTTAAAVVEDPKFPWVGAGVLVLCLLGAAALTWTARTGRRA